MLRKILAGLGIAAILLAGVLVTNTIRSGMRKPTRVPPAKPIAIDIKSAAERLAASVRFRTISYRFHFEMKQTELPTH